MARSELSKPFRLLSTPASVYTREVAFVVKVSTVTDWPSRLPIRGTAYRNCSFLAKTRLKEYGDFILTDVRGEGDYFYFYFSKNKTEAQANVAFNEEIQGLQNHYWPPILLGIQIAKSRMPRSVNTGNMFHRGASYTANPIWIPSADTGTLFILREYLSPTPFNIPQWDTPQPEPVSFPVPGQGMFSFSESLHGDIPVQDMQDADSTYSPSTSTVVSQIGVYRGRTVPATNHKTWLPHYLYDRQTKTSVGSYHRTQMEVIPPNLPKRRN